MKYDGSFFKQIAGYILPSIKTGYKKKKPKKKPISKKQIIHDGINPQFSPHALLRISQRIEARSVKEVYLRCKGFTITGPFEAGWIKPQTLYNIIEDIKGSAAMHSYYSWNYDRMIIMGKIATYAISRDHNIITVMSEFDFKEYDYSLVSLDFIIIWLNLKK